MTPSLHFDEPTASTCSQSDATLLAAAVALPDDERSAFLERACDGDDVQSSRLQALLEAHDEAQSFLECPPADLAADTAGDDQAMVEEKAGDRIGRYKLLQKIGEGGCGVVYMAEQEESVRRRVALKVIKRGMDTKAVIARFEAERQALARMEHPNIARVLDAGATASGRPFFVMELVRGLRITDYCDRNNLSTERRLELFIKVCQAIQHAHQKGVIHRDIKASNLLVTLHDGEPVPKVIDFGIAKATQGRLTEQTLFTAFEQFIGTPAYVSPEQAEMSGLDVDTRSDIYSLGVLLYELLTGRTPFDTQELLQSGIDEMRRRIREQEPTRPSLRLCTLNDTDRTTVARRRGTDAPKLTLRLRGDLDWIVMRCLEKDRSRRYETASGLARDIQRHLRNEPVTARPPSTAYLLQKLIRRHRVAFVAGTAIAATVAAGFGVSTALYFQERVTHERAREAEAQARVAQSRAEQARIEAELGRKRAQDEVARRAKLAAMMTSLLKDIGLHVSLTGGDPRVLHDLITQTNELKNEFADQPEIEAGVDETLSGVYFKVGDLKRAEESLLDALRLRTRAQGRGAPEVAQTLNYLGLVYSGQSRWVDAARCHQEALTLLQDRFGAEHIEVARTLSARGWVLAQQARLHDAEQSLARALEQQRKLGQPAEIAATLTRLGSVLTQDGRVIEAETVLREALRINQRTFGRESLEAASSLNSLAVTTALTQSRLPEAIRLYRDAFEIRERIHSPISAMAHVRAHAWEASHGEFASKRSTAQETESEEVVAPSPTLQTVLLQRDDLTQIEAALRDARLYAVQQYGRDSWEEAFYHALRVWVLLQEQRFADAEPIARQCLAIREQLRPDDWSTQHAKHLLGAALAGQGRAKEAEPLLVSGYREMKARAGSIPPFHLPRLGESARRIAAFYAANGRTDEVAAWQAEFNRLAEPEKVVLLPTRLK